MKRLNIAVVGSGISGLSAAWMLSKNHDVTLFERENHWGGHAHTVNVGGAFPVDCGFIVYNERTYPNLAALFSLLSVPTARSNMGFSVSMDGGTYEYSGAGFTSLLGSARNLIDQAHWRMIGGMNKFFRLTTSDLGDVPEEMTLGEFIAAAGFAQEFVELHLLPVAGAIWSSEPSNMLAYPARAFIRFFQNHGLLDYYDRPQWLTVKGGSREYVSRILADSKIKAHVQLPARRIRRTASGVALELHDGSSTTYDHVVIATQADEALALIDEPYVDEHELLETFTYSNNSVVMHADESFMPKRRRHWMSWNYVSPTKKAQNGSVVYWMNSLQPLETEQNIFISINPPAGAKPTDVKFCTLCRHPIFTRQTAAAQKDLWSLQGRDRIWFAGSYFGSGFHEDGLQSGLAVAEELGGEQRPWSLTGASDRLQLPPAYKVAAE